MKALLMVSGTFTKIVGKRGAPGYSKKIYNKGDIIPFDEKLAKDKVKYQLVDVDVTSEEDSKEKPIIRRKAPTI